MVDTLILIRHAKTEARSETLQDSDRRLTESGKRSCAAVMPRVMKLVPHTKNLSIWSSPAVRAMQTAEIVAAALGLKDIEKHPSLYSGDIDSFLRLLKDESGTVVAVGHNPFMEELFCRLSGCTQVFEKAAAAAFSFTDDGICELQWFVQGPNHHLWKSLVHMEKVLAQAGKRIDDTRRDVLANPDDAEALHQYRISLRVLRSLLAFVGPYEKRKENKRLRDALGALQRETSSLREFDVFLETVSHGVHRNDEPDLVLAAQKAAASERQRFMKCFRQKRTQEEINNLVEATKHIHWRDSIESEGFASACLQKRYEKLWARYEEAFDTCDFKDAQATHAVRKRSKMLRYIAREFKGMFNDVEHDYGHRAKDNQELLGQLCDARINKGIARHLLSKRAFAASSFVAAQRRREIAILEKLRASTDA
ncbi:MAG: CHAD domain-containing protein [Eggerthellaceae bacterium]|jgi:phosphohistidine phosphatase SixA/CHAD domain-containing protein